MEGIQKSIRVAAPVSVIYDYLTAPANLMEIWPSMVEVSNIRTSADGSHEFDWTYKMAGVRFHGHAHTLAVERNRRRVVKNDGIPSTFRWTFAERGGATDVGLEIEYELPIALLAKLAAPFLRRLNEREAETLLLNLKERLEQPVTTGRGVEPPSAAPPM